MLYAILNNVSVLYHWGFEQRKTVTKQRKLTVLFRFKSTFSLNRRFCRLFHLIDVFCHISFPAVILAYYHLLVTFGIPLPPKNSY